MILNKVSSVPVPLDLDEVKRHLRVDHNEDDERIIKLMAAACEVAENYTNTVLIESVYELKLPAFMAEIILPVFPVLSIDSIDYIDSSGNSQPQATWYLKNNRFCPVLVPAYNESWPNTQQGYESVTITLTAGYSTLPEQVEHAILMIIGTLFETDQDIVIGTIVSSVPMSSQTLLDAFKVIRV